MNSALSALDRETQLLVAAGDVTTGVELYRFDPGATAQVVGDACADPAQDLRLTSEDPVLGTSVELRVRGALAGTVP